jgi:hypothetical protein
VDLQARRPPKRNPVADFRAEEFRKFLFGKGLRLTWEQAAECPCVSRTGGLVSLGTVVDLTGGQGHTAEPRPDCEVCRGNGYYHHSPQEVVAAVTGAASNPERFAIYGEAAKGMVSITLMPENLPGFLDRFTMKESVMEFRETRARGAGAVEALRYPVVVRSLDLQGGRQSVGVLAAQKADAGGVTTPDDALTPGVDFEITDDGRIDWTPGDDLGTAPAEGGRYSISYYTHPRFLVIDNPHVFRDTQVQVKSPNTRPQAMPVHCMARLEFLR